MRKIETIKNEIYRAQARVVKSKGVAGYNIVRWHIRVNVLPVRA